MKTWICISKYGGHKFVSGEFNTDHEAFQKLEELLKKDTKRKNRGARLIVHVYQKFGSYAN